MNEALIKTLREAEQFHKGYHGALYRRAREALEAASAGCSKCKLAAIARGKAEVEPKKDSKE